MQIVILYLSTALVFLVIDVIMLRLVMNPLFETHIGPIMSNPIRVWPAIAFYLLYILGIVYFVSGPHLDGSDRSLWVAGAILGAVAYGTFEFTNHAILRDWHWHMVAADVAWGAVLTALSAVGGVMITKYLT